MKQNTNKKEKLQNKEPQLQNNTEAVVNRVAKNCTQEIFESLWKNSGCFNTYFGNINSNQCS